MSERDWNPPRTAPRDGTVVHLRLVVEGVEFCDLGEYDVRLSAWDVDGAFFDHSYVTGWAPYQEKANAE